MMTLSEGYIEKEFKDKFGDVAFQEFMSVFDGEEFDHIEIKELGFQNGDYNFEALITLPNYKITLDFHENENGRTFDSIEYEKRTTDNTPTYYGTGTTDPISYMKQHYTHEQLEGFLLGNIIKYATRANKKNGVEDYKKLAHYAQMLLEHAEGEMKG